MEDNVSEYSYYYDEDMPHCPTVSSFYNFETAYGIVGCIIASFGVLGNVMSIIVLSKGRLCSTTSFFLKCLAIYDTFVLCFDMLIYAIPWIIEICSVWDHILTATLFLVYPLSAVSHTGSIYMVVMLALERFLAVAKPFQAISKWTFGRARKVAGGVLLFSCLYNSPRFFEYQPEFYKDIKWNMTWLNSNNTALNSNRYYVMIYLGYVSFIVENICPLIVLSIFHIQLVHVLRRRNKSILRINTVHHEDTHKLTATVFSIAFVLFSSQTFVFVYNILSSTLWQKECSIACFHLHHVTILVVMVNSATNFIFYCLLGKKFRIVLLELFIGRQTITLYYKAKSTEAQAQSMISVGVTT